MPLFTLFYAFFEFLQELQFSGTVAKVTKYSSSIPSVVVLGVSLKGAVSISALYTMLQEQFATYSCIPQKSLDLLSVFSSNNPNNPKAL